MEGDDSIPCSKCLFWDEVKKSFSCDPNRCKKLSDWLLKHARDNTVNPYNKIIQYVV
jgi:hypothetical protein